MGWSVQVPARYAAERDEEQITALRGGELADDKKTAADLGAWLVFEDESGQGLRPPKGRTWGRRGRTPVVRVTAAISPRLSVAALVATEPGQRPRLLYRTHHARRGARRNGLHRGRLRRPPGCRPLPAGRRDRAHLGQPEHPHQQGHDRADRRTAVADRVPTAAVRPRAESGRAGLGAPEASLA